MKKHFNRIVCILICVLICFSLSSCKKTKEIKYSVYPYLLDVEYYEECIENAWNQIHPEVKITKVDYNCYHDGKPKGIDVIMYDATLESYFVESGFISPIEEECIYNKEDFFSYTLEDIKYKGKLYGIPAILCGDFYIYDKNDQTSINAKNTYDLQSIKDEVLIHAKDDDYSLVMDSNADKKGRYYIDEKIENTSEIIKDIRNIGNAKYYDNNAYELAEIYDDGIGIGYIGYSETLSMLKNRLSQTAVKTISYSKNDNIPLYYLDVVGLSAEIDEEDKDLYIEFMNLMASTELMQKIAKKDNEYSYLIFPRKSAYNNVIKEDELYQHLYEYVSEQKNRIIRHPSSLYN